MSDASLNLTVPGTVSRLQGTGRIRPLAKRTLRESAYLLLDLPVGVIGFSVIVAGLATAASLAITLAGLPILVGVLLLARCAAGLERGRAGALLGVSLAVPSARTGGTGFKARVVGALRDRAAWRASSYFVLMLPAGTLTFSAAVLWLGSSLFLLTLPVWAWALPHGGPQISDTSWWSAPGELAASSAAGLLLLAATPFVIHALTHIDRALLRLIDTAPSTH